MPEPTISGAGLRVVKLLIGNAPQTIGELLRGAGVTRTAVIEQLKELVLAGFVDRTVERLPGRGRPRHLFSANGSALTLLCANNQNLVVPAVWRALEELGGNELTKKVVKRVSRLLAEQYIAKITAKDPKERLQQLVALLEEEGGMVELSQQNGHVIVNKRSCPFIKVLDEKRTICAVDLEILSAVVGRPVRRATCRHDGATSCTFEVDWDK